MRERGSHIVGGFQCNGWWVSSREVFVVSVHGGQSNGERVNVVGLSFDSRHLVGTLEIAESRGASNGFLGVASRPRAVSADPCLPQ